MAHNAALVDLEEVVRAAYERRPVEPEVAKRVAECAQRIKDEIASRGLTDLAVPLIREAREA
jgi:hypothetical protein